MDHKRLYRKYHLVGESDEMITLKYALRRSLDGKPLLENHRQAMEDAFEAMQKYDDAVSQRLAKRFQEIK